MQNINITYFIRISNKTKPEHVIIWKLVTCQQITSTLKKYSTSMGQHLSPRYSQVILVGGYPVLTAVTLMCNICAISVFLCSQIKLARKCEIEHWYSCGANRHSVIHSVYGLVITKFSGMVRFTYRWCSAGAELHYKLYIWGIKIRNRVLAYFSYLSTKQWPVLVTCDLWLYLPNVMFHLNLYQIS